VTGNQPLARAAEVEKKRGVPADVLGRIGGRLDEDRRVSGVTLVLTFLSERFIVQASDRRILYSDGRVSEVMNKAVVIGTVGCAAYTGLTFLDGRVPAS
jgi:hypothetical protein